MAVLLSREVHDWETSACGALSFIPASALLLAEASHAPNGEFIVLDSDYYNPLSVARTSTTSHNAASSTSFS